MTEHDSPIGAMRVTALVVLANVLAIFYLVALTLWLLGGAR